MLVLLDECLPRNLSRLLPNHQVRTVAGMGWAGTKNGRLLDLAKQEFDAFITVDRRLPRQQRARTPGLIIVLLRATSNDIADLAPLMPKVRAALVRASPGSVIAVH